MSEQSGDDRGKRERLRQTFGGDKVDGNSLPFSGRYGHQDHTVMNVVEMASDAEHGRLPDSSQVVGGLSRLVDELEPQPSHVAKLLVALIQSGLGVERTHLSEQARENAIDQLRR